MCGQIPSGRTSDPSIDTMHFRELAFAISNEELKATGPMRERGLLTVALTDPASAHGWRSATRTIATPHYLTDLGVRRFPDPSLYFEGHRALDKGYSAHDPLASLDLLQRIPVTALADHLDSFIVLVGDYDLAVGALHTREDDVLRSEDPDLLLYSGVLWAAMEDRKCLVAFDRAASISGDTFFADTCRHRKAIALLKRFGEHEEAQRILKDIFERNNTASSAEPEKLELSTLAANGLALVSVRSHDTSAAEELLHEAISMSTSALAHAETSENSRTARYLAQELINLAQVFIADNRFREALSILDQNISHCERAAGDYLDEAHAAAAYGHLLAGDDKEAIRLSSLAAAGAAATGSPVRLRTCREICAIALRRTGRELDAQRMVETAERDPLGTALL